MKKIKLCKNCGKEFKTGRPRQVFCSKNCQAEWHKVHHVTPNYTLPKVPNGEYNGYLELIRKILGIKGDDNE